MTCTIEMPGSDSRSRAYVPGSTSSTSWIVLARQRRCCSMMAFAVCSQVSRNVPNPGGTVAAISAIMLSLIGPGPLGIRDTSPTASAPAATAIAASLGDCMQQTLIRTRSWNIKGGDESNIRSSPVHCNGTTTTAARPAAFSSTSYARGFDASKTSSATPERCGDSASTAHQLRQQQDLRAVGRCGGNLSANSVCGTKHANAFFQCPPGGCAST